MWMRFSIVSVNETESTDLETSLNWFDPVWIQWAEFIYLIIYSYFGEYLKMDVDFSQEIVHKKGCEELTHWP